MTPTPVHNAVCFHCHQSFHVRPSYKRLARGKYCSRECCIQSKIHLSLTCETCDQPFPFKSDGGRRFCSRQCFYIALRKPRTQPNFKVCNTCHHKKRITKFYINRANPDDHDNRCILCTKKRYHLHKSQIREYQRKSRKKHSEKSQQRVWKYQTQKCHAPYESFTLQEIYTRDGGICQICGRKVPWIPTKGRKWTSNAPTLDHIVPVSHPDFVHVGHVRTNVRLAHLGCNAGRSNKSDDAQYLLFG